MNIDAILTLLGNLIHGDEYANMENAIVEKLNSPYIAILFGSIGIIIMFVVGMLARYMEHPGINALFAIITLSLGCMTFFYHRYLIRLVTAAIVTATASPEITITPTVTSWCQKYITFVRYLLGSSTAVFTIMAAVPPSDSEKSFLIVLLGITCLVILPKTQSKKK